eukprot:2939867-Amphidinium_carterae.1
MCLVKLHKEQPEPLKQLVVGKSPHAPTHNLIRRPPPCHQSLNEFWRAYGVFCYCKIVFFHRPLKQDDGPCTGRHEALVMRTAHPRTKRLFCVCGTDA